MNNELTSRADSAKFPSAHAYVVERIKSKSTQPRSTPNRFTLCITPYPLVLTLTVPLYQFYQIFTAFRYEMCCDMVDVMLDISSIYGYPSDNDANGAATTAISE